MDYKPRVSIFFYLMGAGFLVFFVLMGLSDQIRIIYLLLAVAAFILGSSLRPKKAPVEPSRFAGIRKMRAQSRQRQQEKKDKKHKA